MTRFRLAALDLDGTLVDSAPDLAYCLGVSLGSVGLPPPSLADAKRWIGDGVEMLVRRGLEADLASAPNPNLMRSALDAFLDAYHDNLFVRSRLYPGVPETLARLGAAGIITGCITNKPEALARDLLEQAEIASLLHFTYGGDTFTAKKPDPEPLKQATQRFEIKADQSVMIGDSSNDREAARGAGFRFIFASYGYARPEDSVAGPDDLRIDSFTELRDLLCGR